jgi:hypothetical protein
MNCRTWINSAKEVQEIGSQHYVKRFVNHDNNARAMSGHLLTITWAIHTFTVSSTFFAGKFVFTADASIRWKACSPLNLL